MFHFKLRAKLNHVTKSFINTNLDLEKNIAKIIVCLSHLYLEECSNCFTLSHLNTNIIFEDCSHNLTEGFTFVKFFLRFFTF